jgi:hypothetical protein
MQEQLPRIAGGLQERMGALGHIADPRSFAVKPRGGNWLDPDLDDLILPELRNNPGGVLQPTPLSTYVDKNLRKWIKTDMGTTESDKLAEELGIAYDMPRRDSPAGLPAINEFDRAINSDRAGIYSESGPWIYAPTVKANPWLTKIDPDTPVYSTSIDELPESMTQMMDYARTLDPKKLPSISVPDMLRKSKAYHDELAAAKNAAMNRELEKTQLIRDYPESAGLSWQELTEPHARSVESCAMGHCVGSVGTNEAGEIMYLTDPKTGKRSWNTPEGITYADVAPGEVPQGWSPTTSGYEDARIFSLRDKAGNPHVTVEARPHTSKQSAIFNRLPQEEQTQWLQRYQEAMKSGEPGVGKLTPSQYYAKTVGEDYAPQLDIRQIKGKQNKAPVETYKPYAQDFVRNSPLGSPWNNVGDLQNTGLVAHSGRYWTPDELTDTAVKYGKIGDIDFPTSLQRHQAHGLDETRARENWAEAFTYNDSKSKLHLPDDFELPAKKAEGGSVEDPDAIEALFRHYMDKPHELIDAPTVLQTPANAVAGELDLLPKPAVPTRQGVRDKYSGYVDLAAKEHGIPADVLHGLIWQESKGDPAAVSGKGARGLTQFTSSTAAQFGVDVNDPRSSINGAAKYLKWLLKRPAVGGRMDRALAAYNGGIGSLGRKGIAGMPAETQQYVEKVSQ